MSFCLDTYLQQSDNYEIHASKAGFKDCAMIIRFKSEEIVYIKPGDQVLGVRVIGIPLDLTIKKELSFYHIQNLAMELLLLNCQLVLKKLKKSKN